MNSTFAGTVLSAKPIAAQRTNLRSVVMAAQTLRGRVVSTAADKTVSVLVERLTPHPGEREGGLFLL
jgi:hypothetical protein